jgi:hypothetical protein
VGNEDWRKPRLSVVVVVYNMAREAPRTLLSLSSSYQQNIAAEDYEIIVVDNGSNPPLEPGLIAGLKGNFRLIRLDPAPPSPARAINVGLAEAKGEVIGVMIDGARLVTPGLLHFAEHGAKLYERAVAASLGWYLGHDLQRMLVETSYDRNQEDALLASIDWPRDGYRLFEIATLDESSFNGWFYPTQESNALFMKRAMWNELGGVDERFDAAGGGLLNLDMFRRAMELPSARLVRLLGEGTFHQLHGGRATQAPTEELHEDLFQWAEQYERIRGRAFALPVPKEPPTFIGVLPQPALLHFVRAAIDPVWPLIWRGIAGVEPPLGKAFDRELWSCGPIKRPDNPKLGAVLDLAHAEFRAGHYDAVAALARLMCRHAPMEPEPRRLLALTCAWLLEGDSGLPRTPSYHKVLAQALDLLDENKLANLHRARIRTARIMRGLRPIMAAVQRLRPLAARCVLVISLLRHPVDKAARQQSEMALRAGLRRIISRLRPRKTR